MKYLIQIIIYAFFVLAPIRAQGLYGKAAVGDMPVSIAGHIALKPSGKLYLQNNMLNLTGNYTGENGSEIYIPLNGEILVPLFFDIYGTANGTTEIIPDLPAGWDGSRIDLVKAKRENSTVNAFKMQEFETDDYRVQLKCEQQSSVLIWYIEKCKNDNANCLPLIVQLANHTLMANNNDETNGGYKFVYYYWYKDGVLIKEGSHDDYGGSYYTGGIELEKNAEYTVKVIDSNGILYCSTPYYYVPVKSPINVTAYPNPVQRSAKTYIQVQTDDFLLLENATVDIYNAVGQHIGKSSVNGQTLTSLDMPSQTGVYILKFSAKDYVKNIKVIVK